ncbi:hypothetical protein CEXT_760211 [Caerostris extrusa]|uniref:Uncharacterized protein n=1 Tax=Caerostris extrusa TaxID=172846 RepID=A0AAV4WRL0_CAEEX|nr:hypothetical protein CEXT_760211 [Caerostris extrusa]
MFAIHRSLILNLSNETVLIRPLLHTLPLENCLKLWQNVTLYIVTSTNYDEYLGQHNSKRQLEYLFGEWTRKDTAVRENDAAGHDFQQLHPGFYAEVSWLQTTGASDRGHCSPYLTTCFSVRLVVIANSSTAY